MNTDDSWPRLTEARARVLEIQTKLHHWAGKDQEQQFKDLFNLVVDPAFLVVAWDRVQGNRGAKTPGVDGQNAQSIQDAESGARGMLADLRDEVKNQRFCPLPVKERQIPKANGKIRRLGIPTIRDRVIQASLKLVLEPIVEADFFSGSYGFRPNRRAQDAIEEIRLLAHKGYHWIFEGDIAACFDEIDHGALMGRLRKRVGDRRVLRLVKAFLKSGILEATGANRDTNTGTPQGGILSPLLANVALSALDDHFAEKWERVSSTPVARAKRRRNGLANYRLVRYADDFVILVFGDKEQATGLWPEVEASLGKVGLRLAPEKTQVVHIDEGFDFLGFRIQRNQQKGSDRRYVYSYPSKKSLTGIKRKVKAITRQGLNRPLSDLLRHLAVTLKGWANYFRHGASKSTFQYLGAYQWRRVYSWLRHKHPRRGVKWLRRNYSRQGWWPEHDGVKMFHPGEVEIVRYRYRGKNIKTPWTLPNPMTAQ